MLSNGNVMIVFYSCAARAKIKFIRDSNPLRTITSFTFEILEMIQNITPLLKTWR
jgi:hypothetical protein